MRPRGLHILSHLSDWTAVDEYEVELAYDLESSPLQIVTDSVLGSEELLWVQFQPEGGQAEIHGLQIMFTDPPQYNIGRCATGWITFNIPLPDEQIRTWTITKTNNESVSLFCNGVEIYNYLFSESTDDDCVPRWSTDVANMAFKSSSAAVDTASDEYREQPTGKCESKSSH